MVNETPSLNNSDSVEFEVVKSPSSNNKYPQTFEELCEKFNGVYVNSAVAEDARMHYVLCEISQYDKVVLIKAIRTNKGWYGRSRIGIGVEKIETVINMLKKYQEESRAKIRAKVEQLLKDEVTRKVLIEELKKMGLIK